MEALAVDGCQHAMEADERIDPNSVTFGLKRPEEAKTTFTTFDPIHIVGEKHLLGNAPEKFAEGKKRVDKLVEALGEDGITSKVFVVFSVATALASGRRRRREVVGGDGTGWAAVPQEGQRRKAGHDVRAAGNERAGSQQWRIRHSTQAYRSSVSRTGECGRECLSDYTGHTGRRAHRRAGVKA
ncbi:unnamed protein product [Pylaiella littoralis]